MKTSKWRALILVVSALTLTLDALAQSTPAIARMAEGGQKEKIQLVVPKDKNTSVAIDAALPMIKKVLAIHQCARVREGLLPLNALALPGVDIAGINEPYTADRYPNNINWMRHHDLSKCLSIRAIDKFNMPALNALTFRVVYYAEDSGETVNFSLLFKRGDDGDWRLSKAPQPFY